MGDGTKQQEALANESSAEALLVDYLLAMLESSTMPDASMLSEDVRQSPGFQKLTSDILALREMSASLAQGDLQKTVSSRGYTIANLKALQANLRHLSWQVKQVAQGDFSQRVDFLGDFSIAFNEMAEKLNETTNMLIHSAHIDQLTGVPNRKGLGGVTSAIFADTDNHFCVLMIDIDHFKNFNDTYGHDVGDEVLTEVAKRAQAQFRKSDHFARFGGEEFVAILSHSSLEVAEKACLRLLKCISDTPFHTKGGQVLSVTISIGLSERGPKDTHFSAVLKRSDMALYDAKRSGRNRFCVRDAQGEPVPVS